MNRTILTVLAVGAAFAAAPAQAVVLTYQADLLGDNERPVPVITGGSGSATVVINDVTNQMRVKASFMNLSAGVTASHIHCCADTTTTAGVATTTPTFPGFPSGVTSGTYDRVFDLLDSGTYRAGFITANGGSVAGARAALLAGLDADLAYYNIHTELFPGGEIRGQLFAVVPEPTGWALMIAGFGLLGGALRARRAVAFA